jgi:hypothetical protein
LDVRKICTTEIVIKHVHTEIKIAKKVEINTVIQDHGKQSIGLISVVKAWFYIYLVPSVE